LKFSAICEGCESPFASEGDKKKHQRLGRCKGQPERSPGFGHFSTPVSKAVRSKCAGDHGIADGSDGIESLRTPGTKEDIAILSNDLSLANAEIQDLRVSFRNYFLIPFITKFFFKARLQQDDLEKEDHAVLRNDLSVAQSEIRELRVSFRNYFFIPFLTKFFFPGNKKYNINVEI
jgi:hypothetical protein